MSYTVFRAEAESAGAVPWREAFRVRTLADVRDELASWSGPSPHHGDVIRVDGRKGPHDVYVFDSARSTFVSSSLGLYRIWAPADADAVQMLRSTRFLCPPTLVALAACACAREALRFAPPGDSVQLRTIEIAEAVVRGDAGFERASAASADAATVARALHASGDPLMRPVNCSALAAAYAATAAVWSVGDVDMAMVVCQGGMAAQEAVEASGHLSEIGRARVREAVASAVRRHIPLAVVLCCAARIATPLTAGDGRML